MKMPGEVDLEYTEARRVLLDALDVLVPHHSALTLVGAQAIYLHVGAADLAVAEFTTDADLAVDPVLLANEPVLAEMLRSGGFQATNQPGTWVKGNAPGKTVDLLVPAASVGRGHQRSARIPPHGHNVARRARGLEGTLVDRQMMTVSALEPDDHRTHEIHVAGPSALIVAKAIKILERRQDQRRLVAKDALDVLRILRGTHTVRLAEGLGQLLDNELSAEVTREAIDFLKVEFRLPSGFGTGLAVVAAIPLEDAEVIAQSCATLTQSLLQAMSLPS